MRNSIQQFCKDGVKNLENIFIKYSNDFTKFAEMVTHVGKTVLDLGLSLIAEELEGYDQLLRDRRELRPDWHIIRRDETSKLTSIGELKYRKTYFLNTKTGERSYLLDKLTGMEPHSRLTEDAVARALDEACDSSYRKGGECASISDLCVSKEAVMDKLRALNFPKLKPPKEKRAVKKLYVDADEDHVSLQFINEKGDIKKPRTNTYMPRLVYVYEGIDAEEGRDRLINAKYFGGGYEGRDGINSLWNEVFDYISTAYDEDALERIYISGDGADWIKAGAALHAKARFALDKYHLMKYIIAATSHLLDSAQDARDEIYRAINTKNKGLAEDVFDRILAVTDSESKRKTVESSKTYVLGHWPSVMTGIRNKKDNISCSAEGHVSHIFSDRLSSGPLGWSKVGADKMARLRVYKKNGGNMLELVRFQKQKIPMAAGSEEVIYSASDIIRDEQRRRRELGAIADIPIYSIPYPQVKKIAAIRHHIWGL